jgi:uncharacterized protein YbjT (DUF2867 family)
VARILIVGGGCRGRRLAAAIVQEGHAVRISTRTEDGRAAIEAVGAECWIGTPDRLATLRAALDSVTVLCWLLGTATGSTEELRALHRSRLQFFLTQAIDTTVRGVVYEAHGTGASAELAREGEDLARALIERNSIPAAFITADPQDLEPWLAQSRTAVDSLLSRA